MFCQNCGRQLNDGENFCPGCGAMKPAETVDNTGFQYDFGAVNTVNTVNTVNAANETLQNEMAAQVFKWGLMGVIFANTACLSLLGMIFSIIAKNRATNFERTFGEIKGRALAGRIMGRIGFGLGLGVSIFFTLYIFIIAIAGLAGVLG